MSWFLVGTAVGAGASYISNKNKQQQQQQETAELKSQQKSQYNAIEQAQLDRQRETDLTIYQQEREARRSESMARASQANNGIAGITANRQLDNVLFQSTLDENFIKTQGLNDLISIRNEGWKAVSGMQLDINRSVNSTLSNKQIYTSAFMSGVSGGISGYQASGGGNKSNSSSSSSSSSSKSSSSSGGSSGSK